MKKIFLVCTVCLFALAGKVFAQPSVSEIVVTKAGATKKEGTKDAIQIESFSWGATNASGAQTVVLPNGRGTLKFDKNGDKITNVVFIEPKNLKNHRALLVNTFPKPGMQPSCKYPLPDACFATADKNIGLCFCKPTNLNNNGPYTITMHFPAAIKQ